MAGHANPRRRGRRLALAAVALAASSCTVRQMIYPAPAVRVPSPPPPPLTEVVWKLDDGTPIVGWAWDGEAGAPAVLFFHGNGENLETMRLSGLMDDLAGLGLAWLAVDYPGYGESGGSPSEAALIEAAEGGLEELGRRFPGRPLAVCGWSLGAAVAAQLAARRPDRLDRLVLLSPWTTLPELAGALFPGWMVRLLLRERYDTLAAAPELELPALVIHGGADRIIPVEHGRRVAAALPAARWIEVPGAGHNDLLARPEVWRELAAFLRPAEPLR